MKKILIFLILFVAVGVGIVYAVTALTVTDSFNDTTKIASAVNVTVDTVNGQVFLSAASSWVCGNTLLDARDGKTYTTSLIGSQCWMMQNLNVGTRVNGSATQDISTSSIQKYCYSDNGGNCDTYGGLYQWNQVMGGLTTEGTTGICPAGWHVPTHNEFTTMERAVCTSGTCATDFPYDTSTTGNRGTNEGSLLKSVSGVFRGLLSGLRYTTGTFDYVGVYTGFWSSSQSGTSAWYRYLNGSVARVDRNSGAKTYGFSVRCLKD